MSDFAGLGFAPGVVRGARSFKVDSLGRLTGVHYESVWRPGENEAECRKGSDAWGTVNLTFNVDAFTRAMFNANRSFAALNATPPPVQHRPSAAPPVGRKKRGKKVTVNEVPLPQPPMKVVYSPAPVDPPEPPPHTLENCSCGFYAYYDGSDDYYKDGFVSGVVEGHGETLIGTRGFRCMKARIVALMIPAAQDRFANRIRRNYPDIPMFDRFADMVAAFPPDGGELGVTPDADDFWTRKS